MAVVIFTTDTISISISVKNITVLGLGARPAGNTGYVGLQYLTFQLEIERSVAKII